MKNVVYGEVIIEESAVICKLILPPTKLEWAFSCITPFYKMF